MDSGISEQSRIVLTLWDTLAINGVMLFRGFYTQYGKKRLIGFMAMDLTMNHILSTLSSPVKKKKYVLIGLCLDNDNCRSLEQV